jgi:hypothetical protein
MWVNNGRKDWNNQETLNIKVEEPTPLTYIDLDDPNDDE